MINDVQVKSSYEGEENLTPEEFIDPGVLEMCMILNRLGLKTKFSCEGHKEHLEDYGAETFYIMLDDGVTDEKVEEFICCCSIAKFNMMQNGMTTKMSSDCIPTLLFEFTKFTRVVGANYDINTLLLESNWIIRSFTAHSYPVLRDMREETTKIFKYVEDNYNTLMTTLGYYIITKDE